MPPEVSPRRTSCGNVARTVIERLYPLCDERRQDRFFFGRGHGAMDAGGKNNADVESGRAVRDKPPDKNVYDLPAGRLPGRVRDDDKNCFAGPDDLFDRFRIDRCGQLFTDLCVAKAI